MTKPSSRVMTLAALAGMAAGLSSCCWFVPSPNCPPKITSQPQSLIVPSGTNCSFTVTAITEPLLYQWQFNGTNIADATNATYHIATVEVEDVGEYQVLIQNPLRKGQPVTVSKKAYLSVYAASFAGTGNGGTLTAPIGSFSNVSSSICANAFDKVCAYTPFDGPQVSPSSVNFPNPANYKTLSITTVGNSPQLQTGIEILLNGSFPPHYWSDCGTGNTAALSVNPLQTGSTYRVGIYVNSRSGATKVSWQWEYH